MASAGVWAHGQMVTAGEIVSTMIFVGDVASVSRTWADRLTPKVSVSWKLVFWLLAAVAGLVLVKSGASTVIGIGNPGVRSLKSGRTMTVAGPFTFCGTGDICTRAELVSA